MPQNGINKATTTPGSKPRYFYGWNIVAASFLANLPYAQHRSSMLGFFFKPLQNEFGWSRSAIAAAATITRVMGGIVAPVAGPLIDRYGPRVLMPIGAIIVGFAMLGVTQINAIWQFYLLRGALVAIGFALMGTMVSSIAISNWFAKKRGRALAISRMGINLGNIAFIPLTVFVIAASGWRTMFVIFAVLTWLFVLIPSSILMRRRPEDMGLYPDGIKPGTTETESPREKQASPDSEASLPLEPVWSRREVLMTGTFWLLAACSSISGMAHEGINISLPPYIQDLGYGDATLVALMTFRTIFMAVALLFMGFVAEHAHHIPIRVIPFLIQGLGTLLLSTGQRVFLWLGVVVYGFGFSGVGIIGEVLWANYFGRLSLGLVRSLGHFVTFGLGAFGPIAMNATFDILGSYQPAFIVISGLSAISAFIIAVARPPKAQRYATAAEMTP
ncbi:MFS transporter [Chloroflexota bacterium]